ncbi:MAG TPA: hypothetical protein VGK59_00110 [Ohtaekwangia sp.]
MNATPYTHTDSLFRHADKIVVTTIYRPSFKLKKEVFIQLISTGSQDQETRSSYRNTSLSPVNSCGTMTLKFPK